MKRIVLLSDGIHRILGLCEGQPPELIPMEDGDPINLVSVHPRYALYRVVPKLPSGRFGEFHPQQV